MRKIPQQHTLTLLDLLLALKPQFSPISSCDSVLSVFFSAHSNGAFHFFNLTSFDHREIITKAELRWFRRAGAVLPGHHFHRVSFTLLWTKIRQTRLSVLSDVKF